jgi:uncharacterized protein YjiS (DUF1127 family)
MLSGSIGPAKGCANAQPKSDGTGKMPYSPATQIRWRRSPRAAAYRTGTIDRIHAVWIWLSRRQAYQDLNSLDDRLLDDVGISRDVVRRLGRPPWWP